VQTFEFKVKPHNGMIKLPPKFQQWDDRQVRIILLLEEMNSTIQTQKILTCLNQNFQNLRINRIKTQ
jgi:hypothetical protein